MKYAYFGHHKGASTWIRTIVEQVLREAGFTYSIVVDPAAPQGRGPLTDYRSTFSREELRAHASERGVDFLSCITADAEQAAALLGSGTGTRGFHVIRDPRDVLVSAYFSHRNSHTVEGLPHFAEHRASLQEVSTEEGLMLEMDFSAQCLLDMKTWDYDQASVLELKMEELTARPYEGFLEIFEFLGLMSWDGTYRMREKSAHFARTALNRLSRRHPLLDPLRRPVAITGEMLLGRVYDHRFEKKARGRKAGQSDVNSHYRKGVAGDWINHFKREHAEHFVDRFGDLLQVTGYETSDDCIAATAVPASAPSFRSSLRSSSL